MLLMKLFAPALAIGLTAGAGDPPADAPGRPGERFVDLAICLDTSGSMKGLIDAARQNIWAIVNDLALAKPEPKLRIALVTFGNTGHSAESGWVEVQTPLTDDLDIVSRKLFALTTNGGDEYVGRVMQTSIDELDWSKSDQALKMIIVAGNEAADQDPVVDFREMCRRAISSDILVNSIYCGNPADELAPLWREVAVRADGQFAAIDQNKAGIVIESPFDEKMTALSSDLNKTYIPFGAKGEWCQENQVAQDVNSNSLNSAAGAQRALTKATSNYTCSTWDLVDALAAKSVTLEAVKPEDLPENMREMSLEERRAHVAKMASDRAGLRERIAALAAKREAFVAAEIKKRSGSDEPGFESAVRRAVKAQAEARGFRYRQVGSAAGVK